MTLRYQLVFALVFILVGLAGQSRQASAGAIAEAPETARVFYRKGTSAMIDAESIASAGDSKRIPEFEDKLRAAIAAYSTAIDQFDRYADAYRHRAKARRYLHPRDAAKLRDALADADRAVLLTPLAAAYQERAEVKMALYRVDRGGDLNAILRDLDEGIKLVPGHDLLGMRASVHHQIGNHVQALADANQSLALVPGNPPVLALKRAIEAKMASATSAASPAARVQDAYLARIKQQADAGQVKAAIATASECIAVFPASVACYSQRGLLQFRVYEAKPVNLATAKLGGKQEQEPEWLAAVVDLTKAIDLDQGQNADLYYQRGRIYLQGYNAEPFKLAMADAKTLARLQPAHAGAKQLLERATDGFASSLAREADQKWVRAAALRAENKPAEADRELVEAIEMMRQVIALAPAYPLNLSYRSRARMYRDHGKTDRAIEDYGNALRAKTNCGDCYLERAEVYRTQRKYDLALADYDKLASMPEDSDTKHARQRVPVGRADTYREMGRFDPAIAEYARVLALDPQRQDAQWGLALAYLGKGDRKAAEAEFRKAIAISWNPKGLREEIAKLGVVLDGAPEPAPAKVSAPSPVAASKPRPCQGAAQPVWAAAVSGAVPADAIAGGEENGRALPVCRAGYNGGVHPGKVIGRQCNIGWGVNEVGLVSFEVLRGNPADVQWLPGKDGSVPPNPVEGGTEDGKPLAICRIPYNGGVHPGKLVAGQCYIGWGGRAIGSAQYEVMASSGTCAQAKPSANFGTLNNVLFSDNFDDNRAGWNLENAGDHTYAISPSGHLVMEGRGNYGYVVQLPHASAPRIDQSRDFDIETSFRQLSGDPAHPIGILWGRKDGTSSFYFGIFADGRYNYGRNTASGWNEIVRGTSSAIRKSSSDSNKIAIRKRGSELDFYINDQFVARTPYLAYTEPLPTVGVTFNYPKRVIFDYFKVMQ